MKIIILLISLILTEFVDSTKDNKIYKGIVTVSGETFLSFVIFFITTLFARLFVRVAILLKC